MNGVLLDAEKQVVVTHSKSLIGQTEVVRVIDASIVADSETKAFEELRRRARLLGADAVVDARFDPGTPFSRVSGVAVRSTAPLPAYEEIGRVEISNPEDRIDSGLKDLLRRAAALGADEVVKIELHRSSGRDQSKLVGVAVKWAKPNPADAP